MNYSHQEHFRHSADRPFGHIPSLNFDLLQPSPFFQAICVSLLSACRMVVAWRQDPHSKMGSGDEHRVWAVWARSILLGAGGLHEDIGCYQVFPRVFDRRLLTKHILDEIVWFKSGSVSELAKIRRLTSMAVLSDDPSVHPLLNQSTVLMYWCRRGDADD